MSIEFFPAILLNLGASVWNRKLFKTLHLYIWRHNFVAKASQNYKIKSENCAKSWNQKYSHNLFSISTQFWALEPQFCGIRVTIFCHFTIFCYFCYNSVTLHRIVHCQKIQPANGVGALVYFLSTINSFLLLH